MMTLEEAIDHCEEVAKKECGECAEEHMQLAKWLKELKERRTIDWDKAPSQVARDIARIVENEQDMRVIAQPEIIRCKDCKNWDTTWTNDFSPNYHYCPMVDGVRKEDWYCADAERRTE